MSQNKEAAAFLSRLSTLPNGPVSLDDVLQPSLADEAELRKLFATDKANSRLKNPHVGLVDVFAAPNSIRTTRARVVKDNNDLQVKHVMPLPEERRRKEGEPAMADDLNAFKKNWAIFTEGSLSQLEDWSNVITAGGSVQACLAPLPESAKTSKRAMRKWYHDTAYRLSDVDLFLYGLNPEQAEVKINAIYEAVRDSVPWDVTCVRTKHTVSIHSQYPYRCVQIVLRLYSSPAEILAGFDVDAPCCAYDGNRVWANPRAIVAMMRQANTVDVTRRSPSYEVRLAKYSLRDFEIYIPNLKRGDIDPTIFERAITRIQGLARLLVLERLSDANSRSQYLAKRGDLRGRPNNTGMAFQYSRRRRPQHKGDLKAAVGFSDIEMSDYDVVSLQIPYGPGWDAKRIEKLIYKTDLGMNTPFNPKNKDRNFHRHSAFFGTMKECLDDCCGECPGPQNQEEHELQDEEDKSYIRGRVAFIAQDPGRQSLSGSFRPIDEGEWSEQAYIQATAKFFAAISAGEKDTVVQMIQDGEDVNGRDQVGRTPLHVAILCGETAIAEALIDADAHMTPRLVGGRSSLHLAAQMGNVALVKKMLARSEENRVKAEEAAKAKVETKTIDSKPERASSEDDWSSSGSDEDEDGDEEDKDYVKPKAPSPEGPQMDADALEDNEEGPDILDITTPDWDFAFTPLGYAILAGSLELVDVLLAAGADAKLPTKAKQGKPLHPLTMTLFTPDEARAAEIVQMLVAAGASSSIANDKQFTIFHRIVSAGKPGLVQALLKYDPNARTALDFPAWAQHGYTVVFPLVTAILKKDYSTLATLLAYGAKLKYTAEDVSRAEDKRPKQNHWMPQVKIYLERLHLPVEVAVSSLDDVVYLLIALGAEFDVETRYSQQYLSSRPEKKQRLVDWINANAKQVEAQIKKKPEEHAPVMAEPAGDLWGDYRAYLSSVLTPLANRVQMLGLQTGYRKPLGQAATLSSAHQKKTEEIRDYYRDVEEFMRTRLPETPKEATAGQTTAAPAQEVTMFGGLVDPYGGGLFGILPVRPGISGGQANSMQVSGYVRLVVTGGTSPVPLHLKVFYDELYQACWEGDNRRIEELCLPREKIDGQELIQITVQTTSPVASNSYIGYTPLAVALHRRHWETARLIIVIASAQYKAPEKTEAPFNVDLFVGRDDNDNDDSDADSDVDMNVPQEAIDFTDVAARPSSVKCDVPASMFLQVSSPWPNADKTQQIQASPLQKGIIDDDLEAFLKVSDLYKEAGSTSFRNDGLVWTMAKDRPDMLDEVIRRVGANLALQEEASKEEPTEADKTSKKTPAKKERVYNGLNVGGKKRKDLAHADAPRPVTKAIPSSLLRDAVSAGSVKIVEYLGGPRVLAAFQHYAKHGTDAQAAMLRKAEDLQGSLPKWLGWDINELNESPLTVAIAVNKLDVVRKMWEYQPELMLNAMDARAKLTGFNALLTAAWGSAGPELIDFLLTKGCNPAERDIHGWNIYHILCVTQSDNRTLKHVLKVLPKVLTKELLAQKSKDAYNTPLMLAVKRGGPDSVKALVEFGLDPSVYLMKDSTGSTVLHVAVQNSNVKNVRTLIEYGPKELLHTENGVGQTPLDIAGLKELGVRTQLGHGEVPRPNELSGHIGQVNTARGAFELGRQKVQVPRLANTLEGLLAEGKLDAATKPGKELLEFKLRMEGKLAAALAESNAPDSWESDECWPTMDVYSFGNARQSVPDSHIRQTFDVVRLAVESSPGQRRLVHLMDVQNSVERNLAQVKDVTGPRGGVNNYYRHLRGRRGEVDLDKPEESEEAQREDALRRSSVFSRYGGGSWTGTPISWFGPDNL